MADEFGRADTKNDMQTLMDVIQKLNRLLATRRGGGGVVFTRETEDENERNLLPCLCSRREIDIFFTQITSRANHDRNITRRYE